MARSARQAKRVPARDGAVNARATALGGALARNPLLAGGSTAFFVATAFVAANALWYQPHAHRGAFFATRDYARPLGPVPPGEPETTFLIERPQTPPPAGDPTVAKVQEILSGLKLYEGTLDGLSGPATTRAVERYRAMVGLPPAATIDQELLVQLGLLPTTSGISPAPRPAPRDAVSETIEKVIATADPAGASERVRAIQAGLRAFGNQDVDVDGLLGPKTRSAVRDFQSKQGMAETGEPDDVVYGRLRELGLIGG
jgi:peptidoglycan hydrolase-like protein with peptidoglycan-binding domain